MTVYAFIVLSTKLFLKLRFVGDCTRAKAKKVDASVHAESTQHTQYKSQAFHVGDKGKSKSTGRGKGRRKSGGKANDK